MPEHLFSGSQPAYLDIDQQQWTGRQIYLSDIRIDGAITTGLRINHGGGGEDLDPMIALQHDVTADLHPIMTVQDTGGGGLLTVHATGGFSGDQDQNFQDYSGFLALSPIPGFSPVLGRQGDDPPPTGRLGFVNRTAQAAAIAATNLTDTTPAGLYEISYYASCTTANVADGTIGLRLAYTDRVGATTQSAVGTLSLAATSTGTTALKGVMVVYMASGNLTYESVLVGAQTTSRYALEIRCKYLG